MSVWKIGNIGYIADSQRVSWQQNWQQTSNKPVTLTINPAWTSFSSVPSGAPTGSFSELQPSAFPPRRRLVNN
jgi:hypothetical protein